MGCRSGRGRADDCEDLTVAAAAGGEACHYGRGHVVTVEGIASVEVAAQTAVSDRRQSASGRWESAGSKASSVKGVLVNGAEGLVIVSAARLIAAGPALADQSGVRGLVLGRGDCPLAPLRAQHRPATRGTANRVGDPSPPPSRASGQALPESPK